MRRLIRIGTALLVAGGIWPGPRLRAESAAFTPSAQREIVPADSKLELVYDQGTFTEGPVATADGAILFSDIGNRILRFDPRSQRISTFREPSGKANGLLLDPEGRLLACEGAGAGGGRRISITAADGTVRTLSDRWEGKRFNSPNDLACDAQGRVYFTDPRYVGDEPRELDFEGVFLVHPDGRTMLATSEVSKPNGILVAADGRTVYLADNDSREGGHRHLLAFEVLADGTLANKRVLFDFGAGRGIDGMTLDRRGHIYATAGRGPQSGVYVFDPQGKALALVPTPGDPTNCVFGIGEDDQVLYITAAVPAAGGGGGKFGLYRIRLAHGGFRHFPPPR